MKNCRKKVILVGGCFDLLHPGHLKFLEAAKKEGDFLIVALENDEKVKLLKGGGRPVNPEKIRAENLLKTKLVDKVIVLPTITTVQDYLKMVREIKPDIIAITSDDPQKENKQKHATAIGAKLKVVIKRIPGCSTTNLLKKI